MKSVELWEIKEVMLLTGDLVMSGESFDHEHGTEKFKELDITNFQILIYVNGSEVDVTAGFLLESNRHHYDRLKEKLLKDARRDYLSAS